MAISILINLIVITGFLLYNKLHKDDRKKNICKNCYFYKPENKEYGWCIEEKYHTRAVSNNYICCKFINGFERVQTIEHLEKCYNQN